MNNLKKFNARELASKHAWLMDDIEKLPPGTEAIEKRKEADELQAELRRRLYSLQRYSLKDSVLPILTTVTKAIVKKGDILFYFDVFSTLNTRIGHFKIPAPTKDEAWIKAREKAKKYSGNVNLKIS